MRKLTMCLALTLGCMATAYAGVALPWIQTADVNNINQAIVAIIQKNKFTLPVLFPSFVPAPATGTEYYANYDITNAGYDLYIDSTADCNGAHYCNVITLNVSNLTVGKLPAYRNLHGQHMTTTILLNNGNQANYTEGFAMADYWNPQITWRQNAATFTLTWVGVKDAVQTRKAMTWMVNNLQAFAPPPVAHS